MPDLASSIELFLEAERNVRKDNALRLLERQGTRLFQQYFRAQGRAFVRNISKYDHFFPPDGTRQLVESLSPSDWDKEWAAASSAGRRAVLRFLERSYRKVLMAGGQSAALDLQVGISLKSTNPEILAFLRNRAALRVAGIDETTRQGLAKLLVKSAEEGWGYKRTAAEIIKRFEGFATGSPLGHIVSRAELIAVHEMGEAYLHGTMTVGRDMASAGVQMEKRWLTAGDERVCDLCNANEGQGWIAFDDDFNFGADGLAHPGDRCDIMLQVAEQTQPLAA